MSEVGRKFVIVVFIGKKETDVVPKSWIIRDDGKLYCFWPLDKQKVSKYVNSYRSPGSDWRKYEIRSLATYGKGH